MQMVLLLASLVCSANARTQLRASQEVLVSDEIHAVMKAHLKQHLAASMEGVGIKFDWEVPAFMGDDQAHGTCVQTKVKLQVGMKKQLQGQTEMIDTAKAMNLDVQLGVSFIDHENNPGVIPFMIVKVILQPLAEMFPKAFAAMQAAFGILSTKFAGSKSVYSAAAAAKSMKAMALAAKDKFAEMKALYPSMTAFLELLAKGVEFGQGLGATNQGFAWTYAHHDAEYSTATAERPSVTFEWRPKQGTNSLTTICAYVPDLVLAQPFGAKLGTCGTHKGVNFQMGLDGCNLSGAFLKWLLPGGVADPKYCDDGKKVPSIAKLKAAIQANFAAAKAKPGLIRSFINVVGDAIKASKLAFFAEIRFASFLAVKVQGDVPISKIIGGTGDGSKGTSS